MKKDKILKKDISRVLEITKSLWIRNNNKTFFLTGCTGFFGVWILNVFDKAIKKYKLDLKVYVLTRNKNIKKNPIYRLCDKKKINFIVGDVRNFSYPKDIKKIDFCVHGATTKAEETFKKQSYSLKKKIILEGTKRVLKFSKLKNCTNFFYLSSGSVYKNLDKDIKLTESSSTYTSKKITIKDNDISALGKSKIIAERIVLNYCKKNKISHSIGRFFTFVGPYMPMKIHYAIGNFLIAKLLKQQIKLNSTGKSVRSYMYISDCIIYFFFILFNLKSGGIYNIGSDKRIIILELSKLINKLLPRKVDININGKNNSKSFYVPSTSKLKKTFPSFRHITLNNSIKKTFLHLKKNKKYYL